MSETNDILLDVRNLKKYFPVKKGVLQKTVAHVQAVDGVDLSVRRGGCLGLVGESGCGKTTTGRVILRLIEPDAGEIWFDGARIDTLGREEMRQLRRDMQIVFQDPFSSLNPRFTVGGIVAEGLKVFEKDQSRADMRDRVAELLRTVGLSPDEAKRLGTEVKTAQFPFTANGRAMTKLGEQGFVRVVFRADNNLVLGIQATGQGVSELSAAFALAIEMGARLEDIAGTIHAHPTQGEAFQEAALKGLGHALHI